MRGRSRPSPVRGGDGGGGASLGAGVAEADPFSTASIFAILLPPGRSRSRSPTPTLPLAGEGRCRGGALHPHRHQDVEGGRALAVLDDRRGARVGELEEGGVAVELAGDVEEVAGVEADIEA